MCLVLSQQSALIICFPHSQRQRQQEVQRWHQKSLRPVQSYTCPQAAQWHQRSGGHLPRPSLWQSHQSAHAKGKEPGIIPSPFMTILELARNRISSISWFNLAVKNKFNIKNEIILLIKAIIYRDWGIGIFEKLCYDALYVDKCWEVTSHLVIILLFCCN